jgi:hypothetical protein
MKKTFLLSIVAASFLMANETMASLVSSATSEPEKQTQITPGSAFKNMKLTDYKDVDGSYTDAYFNAGLTLEGGNQDQTSYDAYIGANANMLYTTASYTFSVNGIVNGAWSRGPNETDDKVDSYDAFVSPKFDKYLFDDDTWFVYGSTDLGYRKQSTANSADDPFAKVGAGMGYGRVYDATPLAKAMRIVEDLIGYGLVNANISEENVAHLAKVINLKDQFMSKYGSDEYKKYWYQAMETALRQDKALTGNDLGAFGIIRISEVLDIQKVSPRYHGWKIRAGFGKIISNYDGESEDPTFDLGFEYDLPIGHEAQFTENALFSTVLDSNSELLYTAQNQMTYTYEISDRVDWENTWQLGYDAYDEGENVMNNTLSTGFRYYIANRLTYNLSFSMAKTDGTNGQSVETPDWDTKFYSGITYRLK